MIERNKHRAGRLWNIAFGFACVVDGLVRVLSLGYLHTRFPLEVTRLQTLALFKRMKAKAQQQFEAMEAESE